MPKLQRTLRQTSSQTKKSQDQPHGLNLLNQNPSLSPEVNTSQTVLQLQRTIGNQAVCRLMGEPQGNGAVSTQPTIQRRLMQQDEFQGRFGEEPSDRVAKRRYRAIGGLLQEYYETYTNLTEKIEEGYREGKYPSREDGYNNVIRPEVLRIVGRIRRKARAEWKKYRGLTRRKGPFKVKHNKANKINNRYGVLDDLLRQLDDDAMNDLANRYYDKRVKVSEENESLVEEGFTDLRSIKKLGGGQVNVVEKVGKIDQTTGEESEYVFKPDLTEAPDAPEGYVGYAKRAVATYRIGQLLSGKHKSFDVIPETHFAKHNGYFGQVMKFAKGKTAMEAKFEDQETRSTDVEKSFESKKKYGKVDRNTQKFRKDVDTGKTYKKQLVDTPMLNLDYSNPDVQEGLVSLHLIDLICGQVDRHGGNFIISKGEDGRYHVWGIDNDFAFKEDNIDPRRMGKCPLLPVSLSEEQAKVIEELNPEDVKGALQGLLSDGEINSTIARLQLLKNHIVEKRDEIVTKKYDENSYRRMLEHAKKRNQETSYVGREAQSLVTYKDLGRYEFEDKKEEPAKQEFILTPEVLGIKDEEKNRGFKLV